MAREATAWRVRAAPGALRSRARSRPPHHPHWRPRFSRHPRASKITGVVASHLAIAARPPRAPGLRPFGEQGLRTPRWFGIPVSLERAWCMALLPRMNVGDLGIAPGWISGVPARRRDVLARDASVKRRRQQPGPAGGNSWMLRQPATALHSFSVSAIAHHSLCCRRPGAGSQRRREVQELGRVGCFVRTGHDDPPFSGALRQALIPSGCPLIRGPSGMAGLSGPWRILHAGRRA